MTLRFDYDYKDISKSLNRIKLNKNSVIFLTSSIGMLGHCKNTRNIDKLSENYFQILKRYSQKNSSTIIFPTYSYNEYKYKNIFDVKKTPSKLGYFSNFILKKKGVLRSEDPFVSVAGFGPQIKKITSNLSNQSYGHGCLFEKLLEFNSYCVNLGLGSNWIPFIHYLDYLNNVKFRFNKKFKIKIINNKLHKDVIWKYYCRYKRIKKISDGYKLGFIAEKKKIYKSINLGRGKIFYCSYNKLFDMSKKMTKKNPKLTLV